MEIEIKNRSSEVTKKVDEVAKKFERVDKISTVVPDFDTTLTVTSLSS